MLSYNTLLAIQLLHVLHKAKGRMLTIGELKYECHICASGNAVGRVIRHLRKEGWVQGDYRSRYRLAVDPDDKSLLDLVIDMDEEIRLGSHILTGCWNVINDDELSRVSDVNEWLRKECAACLKGINLGELISGPAVGTSPQIYESAENRDRAAGW